MGSVHVTSPRSRGRDHRHIFITAIYYLSLATHQDHKYTTTTYIILPIAIHSTSTTPHHSLPSCSGVSPRTAERRANPLRPPQVEAVSVPRRSNLFVRLPSAPPPRRELRQARGRKRSIAVIRWETRSMGRTECWETWEGCVTESFLCLLSRQRNSSLAKGK
jgi:hypothetical protein